MKDFFLKEKVLKASFKPDNNVRKFKQFNSLLSEDANVNANKDKVASLTSESGHKSFLFNDTHSRDSLLIIIITTSVETGPVKLV